MWLSFKLVVIKIFCHCNVEKTPKYFSYQQKGKPKKKQNKSFSEIYFCFSLYCTKFILLHAESSERFLKTSTYNMCTLLQIQNLDVEESELEANSLIL